MNINDKMINASGECERVRKALPKSKALANANWQQKGGAASYGAAANTPYSPGCHSLVCQAPTPN